MRGHNGSSFITIISKENLSDIISNGIQTELIRRGFIAGEKVLIEVDLIEFYSYVIDSLWSNFGAEMVFHIKVRTTEGTRPFQKLIRLRENSRTDPGHEEGYKLALEAVLGKGIGVLVNDSDFMDSIIQAGTL